MSDRHQTAFKEEAVELLDTLESSLLELEEHGENEELVDRIFRSLHTIKGSGSMFGYDGIAEFMHHIESVYDLIRSGEMKATKQLIDLTLSATDRVRLMLNDEQKYNKDPETVKIKNAFKVYTSGGGKEETALHVAPQETSPGKNISEQETTTYLIHFAPSPDIFLSGTNPLRLIDELRGLGTAIVIPNSTRLPEVDEFNPEWCYYNWDILLTTPVSVNEIKDVFIFIDDSSEVKIEPVSAEPLPSGITETENLKDLLYSLDRLAPEKILDCFNKIGRKNETQNAQERKSNQPDEKSTIHREEGKPSSIKVDSHKLDQLVNLVGELVTVQAHLSQATRQKQNFEFEAIAEELERLTWELRDNVLNIRMLPIGSLFGRFKRVVRDLSNELGKQVELVTEGAETELDKKIIESLNEPLVHIIRNCIDHGIETPEARKEAGKTEAGTIFLSARHSGAYVLIEITDDGAGLNNDAVLNKAIEKGIVQPGSEMSEREIANLIFNPGFSTAETVTNISGRGVGMDVVKSAVESLRGTVGISSEHGIGTTVTLKLPLTLAIIDGLLVQAGGDHFIIPLHQTLECIELTEEDKRANGGRQIISVRGELIPYIRLKEKFNIADEGTGMEQIVVISEDNRKTGIAVDKVIGDHQTVIKSVGKYYKHVEEISGATVMGDGKVALIIDVPKFIESAEIAEKEEVSRV